MNLSDQSPRTRTRQAVDAWRLQTQYVLITRSDDGTGRQKICHLSSHEVGMTYSITIYLKMIVAGKLPPTANPGAPLLKPKSTGFAVDGQIYPERTKYDIYENNLESTRREEREGIAFHRQPMAASSSVFFCEPCPTSISA